MTQNELFRYKKDLNRHICNRLPYSTGSSIPTEQGLADFPRHTLYHMICKSIAHEVYLHTMVQSLRHPSLMDAYTDIMLDSLKKGLKNG